MIYFMQGNLFEAKTDALVNTVNTVGVMGKGIALMFKEAFPDNHKKYVVACKAKQVQTGKMFVTQQLVAPYWIINFPTKQHWRAPSKIEWIIEGLHNLKHCIIQNNIRSIAIPALGSGNGKLSWSVVREAMQNILDIENVDIYIYEPTNQYQNTPKPIGTQQLTPARALICELIRRYWVLGMDCSLLEIQKMTWFLENAIQHFMPNNNPLKLTFSAAQYGPYSDRLRHLLNNLDGSYLQCDKRINDANPLDNIWFNQQYETQLQTYLQTDEVKPYLPALEHVAKKIDGFETPFLIELLATVDWLLIKAHCPPTIDGIKQGLQNWPTSEKYIKRKLRLFQDQDIQLALQRLNSYAYP
jgi:O-acetyl-ADP-ribose deacetylase (regulator of RNase III)